MEYRAGQFWCPKCVQKTDFIAFDAQHAKDFDAPLECYVCGYVYDKIRQELNKDGSWRDTPRIVSAIPKWMRRDALLRMKTEFRESAIRAGYRLENFTKRGVRR